MNKDLTKPAGDDLSIEIQQLRMQIAALKNPKMKVHLQKLALRI